MLDKVAYVRHFLRIALWRNTLNGTVASRIRLIYIDGLFV